MSLNLRNFLSVWAHRATRVADALRARAAEAPPPSIGHLAPRQRAAYDRLVDAVNRLPRPVMVMGSLALLGSALIAPDWFAARMEALANMPEALWWLIGAVLSLHYGARYQAHSQDFQRELATTVAAPPSEVELAMSAGPNAALDAWRSART